MGREKLVSIVILGCLGLVAYVVIVGGIVCVIQDNYTFNAYLGDLQKIIRLLFAVLAAALLQALVRVIERRRDDERRSNHVSHDDEK